MRRLWQGEGGRSPVGLLACAVSGALKTILVHVTMAKVDPMRLRRIGLGLSALAAAAWLFTRLTDAQALSDGFLPRLLLALFWAWLWAAGCWLSGERILDWLLPGRELDGRAVHGFAIGVLLFSLLIFTTGLIGLWGGACFVLLPCLQLALGRARYLKRLSYALRSELHGSPLDLLGVAAGGVALSVLFVISLPSDNLSFDAVWYHLGIAEQYAVWGGVVRFPEAPAVATVSHLATWLYTWALLMPWGDLGDRVLLARQIELVMIAFTLLGLPALARALVPWAGRQRLAWLCFFLFPSIFVYDTAPLGAADHVAAFFTVPMWLALLAFVSSWELRTGALLAVATAGLLASKYPSLTFVLPMAAGLFGIGLWRALRGPAAGRTLLVLVGIAAIMLVVTAPHWLKNWIFYGSPLYPALCETLSCSPWTRDSPEWVARYVSESVDVLGRTELTLGGALRALYDYSYAPYTFADVHGATPVFGSLFTACWLLWPWLRVGRRLWGAVACIHVAILFWYVTAHQERYLLPLVPLMAAVVAATLALAWQQGSRPLRSLLALLVLAQLAGAAVIPFLPTHRAHKEAPVVRGLRLLGLTSAEQRGAHDSSLHHWAAIGRALPQGAVVLLHRNFLHLGIGRRVVSDLVPHQFGLSYAALGSLPAIHSELRAFGVTHVGFQAGADDQDSLAGELLFRAFALRATEEPRDAAGWTLARLRATAPADAGDRVVTVRCGQSPQAQLFTLADVSAPLLPIGVTSAALPGPRSVAERPDALLPEADYLTVCGDCVPADLLTRFTPLGKRGPCDALYVRSAPALPSRQ